MSQRRNKSGLRFSQPPSSSSEEEETQSQPTSSQRRSTRSSAKRTENTSVPGSNSGYDLRTNRNTATTSNVPSTSTRRNPPRGFLQEPPAQRRNTRSSSDRANKEPVDPVAGPSGCSIRNTADDSNARPVRFNPRDLVSAETEFSDYEDDLPPPLPLRSVTHGDSILENIDVTVTAAVVDESIYSENSSDEHETDVEVEEPEPLSITISDQSVSTNKFRRSKGRRKRWCPQRRKGPHRPTNRTNEENPSEELRVRFLHNNRWAMRRDISNVSQHKLRLLA